MTSPIGCASDFGDNVVRPQDDFYLHTNGRWLRHHQMPAGAIVDGPFRDLWEVSDRRLISVITGGGTNSPLSRLYRCLEEAPGGESRVFESEAELLRITHSRASLYSRLGTLQRLGVPLIYELVVAFSVTTGTWLAKIKLPDWLVAPASRADRAIGASSPEVRALDAEIARVVARMVHVDKESMSSEIMAWPDLTRRFPGFDWDGWILACGIGDRERTTPVVVDHPSLIADMAQIVSVTPHEVLVSWLQGHAQSLRRGEVDELGKHRGALRMVERLAGRTLSVAYGREYASRVKIDAVTAMFTEIKEALRCQIRGATWCSARGREHVCALLDRVVLWTHHDGANLASHFDEASFEVVPGEAVPGDVVIAIRDGYEALWNSNLTRIGQFDDGQPDPGVIYRVNGFYDHRNHRLVVPPALLEPPYFDVDRSDAENYGALGAIIGHELAHAIDLAVLGDANVSGVHGNWSAADSAAMRDTLGRLVDQCRQGLHRSADSAADYPLDPVLVLNEVLCDHVGLAAALRAFRARCARSGVHCGESKADAPEREFFASWSGSMRAVVAEGERRRRLVVDPHPPAHARCTWVLRNSRAFQVAYGVLESDAMWLAPEDHFTMWG